MESVFTLSELVAGEVSSVAHATARFPNLLRELLYQSRVQPLFDKLSGEEQAQLHLACGYSHGVGWAVLSQALGIMAGFDQSREMGPRSATPLYTPKVNYGGWVRIFRSKAAAFPKELLDTVMEEQWRVASTPEGDERVRGLFGIPAVQPLTKQRLREALLASDLFEAPWMAAVWRPDHGWAVLGAAMDLLEGRVNGASADAKDLCTRPYADQTFPQTLEVGRGTFVIPEEGGHRSLHRPGPAIGIQVAISAMELALRMGYRLDLVWKPSEAPLDSWEDGIAGVAKTPLMGCLIHTPAASFLVAFQVSGQNVRIEGLDERDFEVFRVATGVDPNRPLALKDLESLASMGVPVYGRIHSFYAKPEVAK